MAGIEEGSRVRHLEDGSGQTAESRQGCSVILSERLGMLADMVTPGNRLVDVGCDHGYLSISLVGSGICPRAIAMDVREGPLAAATAHIAEYGLDDYIEVRLSDGLAKCRQGEADTLVCAGMGGRLMEKILREGMEKVRKMRELILQPQSELPQFRAFLRKAGFAVIDEDAVFEDSKYYFAMKVMYGRKPGGIACIEDETGVVAAGDGKKETCLAEDRTSGENVGEDRTSGENVAEDRTSGENVAGDRTAGGNVRDADSAGSGFDSKAAGAAGRQRLYDLYGPLLLQRRHPVLLHYLHQREICVRELEGTLASAGTCKANRRLEEVRCELEDIKAALAFYSGGL